MKTKFQTLSVLAAAAMAYLAGPSSATALQLNYSSETLSTIQFDGAGHFRFNPQAVPTPPNLGSPRQETITSTFGGAGTSDGDPLWMNGLWTIGPVVNQGGGLQTAAVIGVGQLYVVDHLGNVFQGSLSWDTISSSGAGNVINFAAVANLSGITYSGTEADLIALRDNQPDINVVSLQWTDTIHNLSYLVAHGDETSISGSLTLTPRQVPDGGTTVLLLGAALSGLGLLRKKLIA